MPNYRLWGLMALFISAFLGYDSIYKPWVEADQHTHTILIGSSGALVWPMALGFGVLLILLGPRVEAVLGKPGKPSWAAYAIGAVLAGIRLLIYTTLKSKLAAMGYHKIAGLY